MDHWLMQSNASAFLEAGRLCEDSQRTAKVFMAIPAVVCFAFSAELGVKLILTREGKKAWGHDLGKLLLAISTDRIFEIIDRTGLSQDDFARGLSNSRFAFPDWRYSHAFPGERAVSVAFLRKFAEAVEGVSTTMPKVPARYG